MRSQRSNYDCKRSIFPEGGSRDLLFPARQFDSTPDILVQWTSYQARITVKRMISSFQDELARGGGSRWTVIPRPARAPHMMIDNYPVGQQIALTMYGRSEMADLAHTPRIIREKEVLRRTGLSASSLRRLVLERKFPQKRKLGARSVGWLEQEVDEWIHALALRA